MDLNDQLDRLCWEIATEGERFYPPEETAYECIEGVIEQYEDQYGANSENCTFRLLQLYQNELGKHQRAWLTARTRFEDLERRGLNPVERAKRFNTKDGDATVELSFDWYQ